MTLFTNTRCLAHMTIASTFACILFAGAAQAADDRVSPPNPNEVAILRGLLALQHPALKQAMPSVMPSTPSPASLTTEPTMQPAPATTEGEACSAPGSCGVQVNSHAAFRASLERAVAIAGLHASRL
jgi:hypothetical protein